MNPQPPPHADSLLAHFRETAIQSERAADKLLELATKVAILAEPRPGYVAPSEESENAEHLSTMRTILANFADAIRGALADTRAALETVRLESLATGLKNVGWLAQLSAMPPHAPAADPRELAAQSNALAALLDDVCDGVEALTAGGPE